MDAKLATSNSYGAAGRLARARYHLLATAWRKRMRPLFAALGIVGAGGIAGGLVAPGYWKFALGFLAGSASTLALWLYGNPPARIQNWRWGSEGEERTAQRLRSLQRTDWHVWHDIPRADGTNIDHIVLGPAGLFLIDSKEWTGLISIEGGQLRIRPREDPAHVSSPTATLRAMKQSASRLSEMLQRQAGIRLWVQPIAAVWGAFEQRTGEVDGVVIVHGDDVATWLQERPRLDQDTNSIASFLNAAIATGAVS